MNEIMQVGETLNGNGKITSLDVVRQVNVFRNEEGNRSELGHNDLMKIIRDEFAEEIGAGGISQSYYTNSQNKQQPMYELTLKQARQVLLRESKFVRKAVLNWIEILEAELRGGIVTLPNFNNPAEAARAWADQFEQRQIAEKQVAVLAEQNKRLVHSKKLYTTTEVGKELGYKSAIEFNQLLCDRGIQFKQNNTWILYSKYAYKGYVSIKQDILDSGRIIYDRKWTGLGRDFLIENFGKTLMVN